MSSSSGRIVLIVGGILLAMVVCGVCLIGGGALGYLTLARTSSGSGSPTDPTNPDRALYLEIANTELGTLENGNNRLLDLMSRSAENTITVGSDEWVEEALIAENLIANGHDILASVTPPTSVTALHATVMDAAETCYLLNGQVYDAYAAALENLYTQIESCAQKLDSAQSALAAETP